MKTKKTNLIAKHDIYLVFIFLFCLSVSCSVIYFLNGENVLYADTMSRLDIARKIIDNLTPGFAQIGNVWLPLPQLLMLPFIWNKFLWHSGLAGTFMSATAFIIGGLYIYKSAKLLTNSIVSSILCLCIYALNTNELFLQSTAMSESVFLCAFAAAIYYFIAWVKTNDVLTLIPAGLAVSAMTYTRYEGWSVLLASVPMVFLVAFIRSKKYTKAEGATLLYGALAFTGFAAWTLYLALIFGDPLYWVHYYATPQATGAGAKAAVHVYTQQKTFLQAVWQYFTSCVWMIGLTPMIFSVLGILGLVISFIRKRTLLIFPLLMPLSIFLFMVLTLQRNTPIVQPSLTLANIFSGKTSLQTGFNIRYGILLLPWVAVISSYILNSNLRILKYVSYGFFCLLFGLQIWSYSQPNYSVIYQIPTAIYAKPNADLISFMQHNYKGGEILISAAGHEDQMFSMGFDYKSYIHEGTGKYWKESVDDPPHYASWVIYDLGHPEDELAKLMKDSHRMAALNRDFNLVFTSNHGLLKVYKIKNKPFYQI